MRKLLWLGCLFFMSHILAGQSFEISGLQDNYRGLIGETIKAPIRFKNTTDKTITLVIKKVTAQIGGTQKNYFCIDNACLDHKIEEYSIKMDPDQTINIVQIALDGGLAPGTSSIKYTAFTKTNPTEIVEFDLNFLVEEKSKKENIYNSRQITLHDVYPNPVSEFAFADYTLANDQVKAKIVIHNILGNSIEEYPLTFGENKVKVRVDALSAGIYFYTLYVDNEGVITRKLIVKK
jgi:hypothetical protein